MVEKDGRFNRSVVLEAQDLVKPPKIQNLNFEIAKQVEPAIDY